MPFAATVRLAMLPRITAAAVVAARPAVIAAAPRRFPRVAAAASFATEAAAPTVTPGKLLLNFAVPHQSILNAVEATQVNVQTSGGDMGILSDHVPSISQLNAGVVEILGLESGKPQKYFVSGGFAIINADSTLNINAVEAFPLEELDAEAARRGLEEATRAETASGASEADKATARIERETFEAILYSLAQK